jgi:hypothetical protein
MWGGGINFGNFQRVNSFHSFLIIPHPKIGVYIQKRVKKLLIFGG